MSKRIRLSRKKGSRKPEAAVTVARPTKWGNPFKISDPISIIPFDVIERAGDFGNDPDAKISPEMATLFYELWISSQPELLSAIPDLFEKDLACWCSLGTPCHADVLLRLATKDPQ